MQKITLYLFLVIFSPIFIVVYFLFEIMTLIIFIFTARIITLYSEIDPKIIKLSDLMKQAEEKKTLNANGI